MSQEHKPVSSKNSMKFLENGIPDAEGVTRPEKENKTKKYNLLVRGIGNAPMKLSTYAENKQKAIKYATKRWGDCIIEVIE